MSQSVLTNLDLNQNQIENAAVHNLSEAPTNPVKGQQYFNTTDNKLYYYDGTNWVKLSDNIDLSGLATKSEAAGSLSVSNATLTLKNVNGGTLSTVTVNNVANATKATQDASGNVITTTYSTKAETVTGVVAGSTADKIDVTKNGSTSTITVNNVANADSATKDGDGNVISSTYLKTESDTLATVLNRGNSASTDINFNSKDWFNAGIKLTSYKYSTSQTPNTQYYWYKIEPPASGSKADRYFISIDSDVNYPDRRATFLLDISCYGSGTSRSVSVSLNCLSMTGGKNTNIMKCAIDTDGNVYVQSNAIWSSYMRFVRYGTENDTKEYTQVGLAAFGTAAGFTPLKMITDTGCIRIVNGALSGTYHTVIPSDYFRGIATNVFTQSAYSNADRHVFFAYQDDDTQVVYNNKFKYNPSTNILTVGTVNGNLTGTASKATADADGNTISTTYAKKSTLATVATSGSYNDLTNKPTIAASTSGSFTTSNWILSNSKYNYTITLETAQLNANVLFYDSNNQQVFPEEIKLTKSNGKITSVTAVIGSDPDCRFSGTYSIFY